MSRLKPAPDPWIELRGPDRPSRSLRPCRTEAQHWIEVTPPPQPRGVVATLATALGSFLQMSWMILTLPFRLAFGVLQLLGRLLGLATGFTLMVVGAALLPGPFLIIGVPLFAIGLLLSMRSLG